MRRVLSIFAATCILLLPACGTPGLWKHKNKSIFEFYPDDTKCREEAREKLKGKESESAFAIDEGTYNACMNRKGWRRKE